MAWLLPSSCVEFAAVEEMPPGEAGLPPLKGLCCSCIEAGALGDPAEEPRMEKPKLALPPPSSVAALWWEVGEWGPWPALAAKFDVTDVPE